MAPVDEYFQQIASQLSDTASPIAARREAAIFDRAFWSGEPLDELFEPLTVIQTRKIAPLPVILVGEEYWRRVFDPVFLVDEGVIDPEDRTLFWFAETADEIWDDIERWYQRAGTPITG